MTAWRAIPAVVFLACCAPVAQTGDMSSKEQGGPREEVVSSLVAEVDERGDDHDTARLPRSEGRYRLTWMGDNADICFASLAGLNKPHKATDEFSGKDYAAEQAARMLGSIDMVSWSSAPDGDETEQTASLDYFNDGVERLVVRISGELHSNRIIGLGVRNDAGDLTLLQFGHAGAALPGLPDIDNLHAKLTYSVADVLGLDKGFVTALAPLEDFDPSGTVFIITWKAKENAAAPYEPGDYYPRISCILAPENTESPLP